jgi:hypothetical protein
MAKRFITDVELEKKTLGFLGQYQKDLKIPVPIEEIVELELGLEIIPLPRLWEDFRIDGFLNSTLNTITVAQFHLERNPNRYRFTLAHEVGHLVLHKEYIQSQRIENYKDWIKFYTDNVKLHSILETQANSFAGFLLMPSSHLESVYLEEKEILYEAYPESKSIDDFTLAPYLAKKLAGYFEVSEQSAQIRLERWLKSKGF